MGKKSGKHLRDFELDALDDFDDFDDGIDLAAVARGFPDSEWEDDLDEKRGRGTARRKIERRREMKKLYSELNDWEEFGLSDDWR
ncbi:MAG: hypothetical protein P8Y54_08175 [Xanthomonadales bacterium]|jgi:hypothetical protein